MSQIAVWNDQLQICREKLQLKEKWVRRLNELNRELEEEYLRTAECLQRLREEEADVEDGKEG